MSAPDFIWAEAPDIFDGMSIWYDNGVGPGTPYIRRDPAALAELPEVKALIAAARNDALREAADLCPFIEDTARILALIQEAPK